MKNLNILGIGIIFMLVFGSSMANPSSIKVKAEVEKAEYIYEKASFPECHASTIVETKEGLLAAWFGGTHENHPDVCIYTSTNINGKWSEPSLAADGIVSETLRYPCWNP